jgi:hypothetical protein
MHPLDTFNYNWALPNPLTLPFKKWGHLEPLSWVKMLWCSLEKINIQLHMKYPILPLPQERDQVIMEIILKSVSSMAAIQSLIAAMEC